ncbi:Glycosidase [Lachnospiraceae bacterium KHCPX20]|nr:Glycosidase [Lachnospiraceae bacterium KHCPX20]
MKKRSMAWLLSAAVLAGSLTGCAGREEKEPLSYMQEVNEAVKPVKMEDKYRNCYEIFVYSFYDSDGDGIGDLKGVDEKLDYIASLGANQIWLMPVCPSPTYHKYDVTDYMTIDPAYGNLEDFKKLVKDCHKRGISVITDLVLNHTSSEHPWFQEACAYLKEHKGKTDINEKDCPYLSYYQFEKSDHDKNGYARLKGTDYLYEAQFWEGMPDLNLDHPAVRKEIEKITAFWTSLGVDGYRLDATTSYYTGRNSKNIKFMTWLNNMIKKQNKDAYIVGEAWCDSMTYTSFYQSGIDSFFDFDFAGNDGEIAQCVRGTRSAKDFGKTMIWMQDKIAQNGKDGIDAPFYTNHDMARSAGYYAMDDKGEKTKFAEGLNLMMSGNAFLYYGEEIGMKGSGIDENKRAPMYWSKKKSKGMTKGPQGMEAFDMKFAALDKQKRDPYSIYSYVQQALRLRRNFPAIARGNVSMDEDLSNEEVLVIEKKPKSADLSPVVLVYNMSEKQQEVDLSKMAFPQRTLSGVLTVNKKKISLQKERLLMPGRSIAVLTQK